MRLDAAQPDADRRRRAQRDRAAERAGPAATVLTIPDDALFDAEPAPGRRARRHRSVPDHLHQRAPPASPRASCTASATSPASGCRPTHWLDAAARRPGVVHGRQRLVEVGAQRVHRARGSAAPPRCCTTRASIRRSGSRCSPPSSVNVLCMAPTEYRVIAKRVELHAAAGAARAGGRRRGAQPRGAARLHGGHRARDPRRLRPDRDRPAHRRRRPASASARARWAARCRASTSRSTTASWSSPTRAPTRRSSSATSAAAAAPADRPVADRRPRHARRGRLPVLRGPHRRRDHLGRLPDRPVRGRVGARLPRRRRRGGGRRRPRRGARRGRARGGRAARRLRAPATALATELQDHVKHETAPYKYPRIVDFAAELPKTAQRQGPARAAAGRA